MNIKAMLAQIEAELKACLQNLNEGELERLEGEIGRAERIFVAGAGRSLLMVRAMAMRLMHIGLQVYVVGETTTPAIGAGDLMILVSGSGSTGTLTVVAQRCRQHGARLALITTHPDSAIGRLADLTVEIRAATTKEEESAAASVQLGANTFEQSVLLIGDAIVMDMIGQNGIEETNAEMMRRHANLE